MQSFTITITGQVGHYTLTIIDPHNKEIDNRPFIWQLSPELTDTLHQLADERASVSPSAMEALGTALYNALFTPDTAVDLNQAKIKAQAKKERVRLRLQIEPPELAALPWEAMRDKNGWLALDSGIPLVRRLTSERSSLISTLEINKPLRILFIGASPKNMASLDVAGQFKQLQKQLTEPLKKNDITLTGIFNPTQEKIRTALLKEYHIIYFAGHGTPARREESFGGTIKQLPASIAIDDGTLPAGEAGNAYPLTAETLAGMLKGRRQTRLLFLGACNTSATTDADEGQLLSGFAQELIQRANLPAIVAMQYFISDKQAMPLTAHFFAAIAQFNPVDVALAEARNVVVRQGQPVGRDLFAPVLYLQAENASLFKKALNRMAWALAALLVVVLILGAGISYYQQGETAQERHSRMAAETREAITQITAEAEAENRAIAESTAQAESTRSAVSNLTRRLANQASQLMDAELDPELSTLLAIEAVRTTKDYDGSYTLQAEEVLRRAVKTRLLATFSHRDNRAVRVAKVNKTNDRMFTKTDDGKVHLWDVNNRAELLELSYDRTYEKLFKSAWISSFNKDGSRLIVVGTNSQIHLIDTSNGNIITSTYTIHIIDKEDKTFIQMVDTSAYLVDPTTEPRIPIFSPDGNYLLVRQTETSLSLINVQNGTPVTQLTDDLSIIQATFSPDSKLIVTAGDGGIKIWDTVTGQLIRTLVNDIAATTTNSPMVFSPNGNYLVTAVGGHKDSTGYLQYTQGIIWDVASWRQIASFDRTFSRIVFSPNNEHFITMDGFSFSTSVLWDIFGTEIIRLPIDGSATFSPDGKYIVCQKITPRDDIVALYNVETGQEVATWQDGDYRTFDLANNHLALNEDDVGIIVDTKTGQQVEKFSLSNIFDIEFDSDEKFALALDKSIVKLWDIETGIELATLSHGSTGIVFSYFSSDDQYIITIGNDGTARLWSIQGLREPITLTHENVSQSYSYDGIRDMVFNTNGDNLITNDGQTNNFWKITPPTLVYSKPHYYGITTTLASFSPDGNFFIDYISTEDMAEINLVDTKTGQRTMYITAETSLGIPVFSHDSRLLANIIPSGTVEVWDIKNQQRITTLSQDEEFLSAAFSGDDKRLFVGKRKGLVLWNITTQEKIADFEDEDKIQQIITRQEKFFYTDSEYKVSIWNISNQQKTHVFTKTDSYYGKIILSSDEQFLALMKYQNHKFKQGIYLFHTQTGQLLSKVGGSKGTFTPDNKHFVVLSGGIVEIVDTQTGETVDFLKSESSFRDFSVHPNNSNIVATVNADGQAQLWDLKTHELLSVMSHGVSLSAVAFSPDGKRLATGDTEGTIKIWLVEIDDLIEIACNSLSRNLSQEEWLQYMDRLPYHQTCPMLK